MATSPAALACGGTFCDGGVQAMPVDQTGENILFAIDDGMVEVHIQILYEGEAERFAWVLPLPAVPESLSVGSTPLFTNLLNGTVPSYGYNTVCGGAPPAVSGGGGNDTRRDNTNPLVVVTKQVGAFEVSILEGGTADEVIAWLEDNGYEQIPEAEAILEEYVDEGHVFAAVKLTADADVDEIHPIVVRYPGDTPCVPLRLTRVAATENMGVRVFFLGDERYVPSNYKHVTLNPVAIDWSTLASNYLDVVSAAVDTEVADGQAFITEFAGASSGIARDGIYYSSWDGDAFVNATPAEAIEALEEQGFISCSGARCNFSHPLIEPLLGKYLPPPDGVDAHAFYDCIECYEGEFDETAFDGSAFGQEFMSRIVVPGRDASELLSSHPFLTRMFTTISPDEMTVDPTFHAHGTDPVNRTNQVSRVRGDDYYSSAYQVTEDWVVELTQDTVWPEFEDMPYALRIEQYQPDGDRIELVDFSDDIESALMASNREQHLVGDLCRDAVGLPLDGAAGESGEATVTSGSGAGGSGGSSSTGTVGGSGGGESQSLDAAGGGCSCRMGEPSARASHWWALGLLGLCWRRRYTRRC